MPETAKPEHIQGKRRRRKPRPIKAKRIYSASAASKKNWKNRHTSGAAGPCKRIDPKTGKVIEVLS